MSDPVPPRAAARQLSFFDTAPSPPAPEVPAEADPDAAARAFAVDPRHNVVLEASAGTGKTSVLVARYVNLLKAGVDPANILAITFTRKAAAEMRERIVRELRAAATRSEFDRARWLDLRDRLGDIAISTIDAFCLSLLREFPLEADVDPGFDLADETEVPRLIALALDRAMRLLVSLARTDEDVALVLAQLGLARTREGLSELLDRRLVAWHALDRFLARGPQTLTAAGVCGAAAADLHEALAAVPGGLVQFLADGPAGHPRYELFRRDVRRLDDLAGASQAAVRGVLDRVSAHFLTNEGKARRTGTAIQPYKAEHYPSKDAAGRHRETVFALAPRIERVVFAFKRDLNVVLARGVRRMFGIALAQYRQALEERAVLDFSDVLERAVDLLRRMDEFSQSRFRLESRYHHVLVDEFQDTSRAQWELVSLLVQAWGEGQGLAASPSIFIVGDRKQSIYRFRDAEVAILEEAARYIDGLRPEGRSRHSIARSFRAVPELLQFVNDLFSEMSQPAGSAEEFTYQEGDRFPVSPDVPVERALRGPALGLAVADSPEACASAVAAEIARLLDAGTVRDKTTGLARPARPGDIAILFRSRSSHREFERELGARGIPTFVYKGLGFFDADEIKDLSALLRYLAEPSSPLRAAALLRSGFIRLSDPALAAIASDIAGALTSADPPTAPAGLDDEDCRVLEHARVHVRKWLGMVDRIAPAELMDRILAETAYAFELRGARRRQAWENVKKMRGLVRRIQNRGYATMARVAEHLGALSAGDESNAAVEALDAINLMTVHAAKGLEFPIVFVVNLAKGASGPPRPVRVIPAGGAQPEPAVAVGPFITDTDELERERERHETRRLLYVALTRARDALYLASTLKDGVMAPGRGSLAEVLPDSLKTLFERAREVFDEMETVAWRGVSGHEHAWRLCRPVVTVDGTSTVERIGAPPAAETVASDLDPITSMASRLRIAAGQAAGSREDGELGEPSDAPGSDALIGTLVHRLFQFAHHLQGRDDSAAVAELAGRLLRVEESATVGDPRALASRAAEVWRRAAGRPDVRAALDGEGRLYEVPFSLQMRMDGAEPVVIRGTIDCLVRMAPDSLRVVEIKTGRRRHAHERQLDIYVRAVRALYPGAAVHGVLVYV